MQRSRQALSAVVAVSLLLSTFFTTSFVIQASQAAAVVDEQYAGSEPPSRTAGTIGAIYDPSREDSFGSNYLFASNPNPPRFDGIGFDGVMCKSAKDEICSTQREWLRFFAYLQECNATVVVDCVAGVTAIKPDGTEINGIFQRRTPATSSTDFEGDSARNIPNGRSPGLWQFPSITHQGGSDFLVAVTLEGLSMRTGGGRNSDQLRMAIFPVSSVTPARTGGVMTISKISDGTYRMQGAFDRSHVYHSPTEALNRWPFPPDLRYRLKIKLNSPQQGWLHGRVFNPTARVEITDKGQEIDVEAAPVSVPVIDPWTRWTDLPQILKSHYGSIPPGGDFCKGWVEDKWEELCINVGGNSSANLSSMKIFLEWLKIADDRSVASKTTWSVRSMKSDEISGSADCYRGNSRLTGFVSTNSTVYLAGPPTFNAQTQSLDYKVASPHFDKAGKLTTGTYTLMMRSSVARCIYDFTDAPINASISILSADGKEQIATTSVVEKDGWLTLNANGFTYSSPTLRVSLSQDNSPKSSVNQNSVSPGVVNTPEPRKEVAAPKVSTKKSKTIICTKGATARKITGIKPKCPAGYRQK